MASAPSAPPATPALMAPEYPDTIPATVYDNIVVPLPKEIDPEWTTNIPRFYGNLASFPERIDLPDPLKQPGYYAAAADTIRLTNWRLISHQSRNPEENEELEDHHVVTQLACWNRTYPDKEKYPPPPDPRTLYVLADDRPPMTKNGKVLWTQACDEFALMEDYERWDYLHKTRPHHVAENELVDGLLQRGNKLEKRIYKRYLAWHWHEYERKYQLREDDQQPTRAEMQAFFEREDIRRDGASLAEVCHFFPHAKDAPTLVYRIERIAKHKEKPDDRGESVESVYKLRMRVRKCSGHTKNGKRCRVSKRGPVGRAINCGRHRTT